MKVTVLLENTACREDVKCAHGLSMHIASAGHSILFDMGPNAAFLENARRLGVDVSGVDVAFLSHAHDDHSGGLELFCKRNEKAPVYLQRNVWGAYYVVTPDKCKYIGLDKALRKYENRFRYASGVTVIDDALTLFSGGMGRDYWSHANDTLRERRVRKGKLFSPKLFAGKGVSIPGLGGGEYLRDDFRHEQCLLVTEGDKTALFGGCAHNGIVNILRRAEEILGRAPDAVFAGFHLYNPSLGQSEPRELVADIARELKARENTVFYTGHCTGQEAFAVLRETMGEQLIALQTGRSFEI